MDLGDVVGEDKVEEIVVGCRNSDVVGVEEV